MITLMPAEPTAPPVFPFVVGCGRSGTTLLRALLDAHPLLAVAPESHFVVALDPGGQRIGRRRFRRALARSPWFALWDLDPAAIALERRPRFADAVRATFAAYARARGKPRYADKTPHYVSHLPRLAARFGEARFVHLIRDGRDVAASLRRVPWGPPTLDGAAAVWARRVREGRAAEGALGPGRYREVRYEALVAAPQAVVDDLLPWLGLPPAVLRHDPARLVVPHAAHHERLRLPPTPGLRDWRRELTAGEVAEVQAVAGPELSALGY